MPGVVGAVIIAGSSIYGAHKAADANKKAAEIQGESADKATTITKEMYDQDRADLTPYRQMGVSALGQLRTGMGYPDPPPESAPTTAPNDPTKLSPEQRGQFEQVQSQGGIPGRVAGKVLGRLDAKQAQMNQPAPYVAPGAKDARGNLFPGAAPQGGSLASIGPQSGGLITCVAPTGEVEALTPDRAERAIANGARRL